MFRKVSLAAAAAFMLATATTAPAQAHDGGAIAAGIIGGLALGGLAAAAAAQPAYGYGYPVYVDRPVYRRVRLHCWREPHQAVDYYGGTYWRSVRVCR